jgi:hypothetical protein
MFDRAIAADPGVALPHGAREHAIDEGSAMQLPRWTRRVRGARNGGKSESGWI